MITRSLNWIATIDNGHESEIKELDSQLRDFYSNSPNYYKEIDFTANNWIDPHETGYKEIIKTAETSEAICEIGCGSANILKHYPHLAKKYSGCDFSEALMAKNTSTFPYATFSKIEKPNSLPFEERKFDLLFSYFVLKHSTNPSMLLVESARIVKPGGTLILLCPEFI